MGAVNLVALRCGRGLRFPLLSKPLLRLRRFFFLSVTESHKSLSVYQPVNGRMDKEIWYACASTHTENSYSIWTGSTL